MHDAEQFRYEPAVEPASEDPEKERAAVAEDLPTDAEAAPDSGWVPEANVLGARLDAGLALLTRDGLILWCNRSFELHHPGGPWADHNVLDLHDPHDPVYESAAALRLENEPDAEYRFEREVAGRVVRYCLRRLLPPDTQPEATQPEATQPEATQPEANQRHGQTADQRHFLLETSTTTITTAGVRPGPFPEALVAADGAMLAVNTAMAELIGEQVGSLIGRPLTDLVDTADRARVLTLLSDTARAGATAVEALEVRLAPVEGIALWAELVMVAGPGAGEGSGGSAGGFGAGPQPVLVQARDITARKRDALLLQEVFEAAPLPYALVDTVGVVVGVNPAWRQRLGPRHGPGRPLTDAVAEESRQQLADLLGRGGMGDAAGRGDQAAAPTGTVVPTGPRATGFELVTLLELAEGGPALARLQATALHDLDQQVERLLVSLDDLTAHALEVEAARRVSGQIRATLDELDLAVVSHDSQGRAQELNLGAVRLFGDSAADLIGCGPLPPGWHARRRDQTLLADADHPLARVLAAGGPLAAADVLWLAPQTGPAEPNEDDLEPPTAGTCYLVRARAVTQLRPPRRLGAVVAYAQIEDAEPAE